jgi:ribosomal protein L27
VGLGKDHTLFATAKGTVQFKATSGGKQVVSVKSA